MKQNKFFALLAGIFAFAALAGCQQKVEDPFIRIEGEKTLTIGQDKATITVKILSNRDWRVRMDGKTTDWMVVEPDHGAASDKAAEVTLTVAENTGANRTAAIEFYTGIATEMLTVIQLGPKGDSDGVESLTVEDFIKAADKSTYYRLTGTVSSFQTGTNGSGKDWMQFNLTDDTGTILVYGFANGQYEEWSGRIKNGGTLTLQGQYEYYSSKSQHEVVNATIESFTPGEEQNEITASTIADFIAKASSTIYYRLSGTVSDFKTGKNNSGKDWMQFNITDDTGTILVYGFESGQFEAWSTKIKNNGTVVLVGTYEYYSAKNQHEVMNATIESFTEGAAPQAAEVTVAEAVALPDNKSIIINEATVAAMATVGLVVTDGTANIYIYFDSKNEETVPDVAIGDIVKVEATKFTYGGVPELKTPTVTKLSAGEITYPAPKDLNPIATTYASGVTEFVQMTGTLKVSGNYYNVEMDGVDSGIKMGSVVSPLASLGVASFVGKRVVVKGYFTGLTGSNKYINVVATEVTLADAAAKYCTVTPTTIGVKADATSASFNISSDAAWTVTSDNEAFTVSPASGSGDATVTVTFPVNEDSDARVANITVKCAEASVETVVVLTQAKPSSGEEVNISIDFTSVIPELPQGSGGGLENGTYTFDGYTFVLHAADKFYQAKNGDKEEYYLLIGKTDSYIQLPVLEGKALTKVAFLTGAGASENVIVDVCKEDGTRLNVNDAKLKKGTRYEWEINGEAGVAYRLLVVNKYNAQFQNLTLTYE